MQARVSPGFREHHPLDKGFGNMGITMLGKYTELPLRLASLSSASPVLTYAATSAIATSKCHPPLLSGSRSLDAQTASSKSRASSSSIVTNGTDWRSIRPFESGGPAFLASKQDSVENF